MSHEKAVMISIKPEWCDLIVSGKKIDEIRKTRPKLLDEGPLRVFIYRTTRGKVIGEFTLRKATYIQAWIDEYGDRHLGNTMGLRHCIEGEALFDYLYREAKPGKPYSGGWAWRIEDLVVYDEPKPLDHFDMKRPPQSWCYIERK